MQTTMKLGTAVILTALAMVLSVLVTAPAEANTGYHSYSSYSGPCPHWSIERVLADRNSDWDGDRLSNVDEVWVAGTNPCKHDSASFCGTQPQYCYHPRTTYTPPSYNTYYYDPYYGYYYVYVPKVPVVVAPCTGGKWTWNQVNAHPYRDWDGDGVTNYTEAVNGANPCVAPCPTAYTIDVRLNPWGDWDHDGLSNHYEVSVGSNPCVARHYHQTYTYVYTTPAPRQLPHVGGPSPTTGVNSYSCPAGYPYYHPANGQCYANPINPWG